MPANRRTFLTSSVAVATAPFLPVQGQKPLDKPPAPAGEPFGYCLNTSTIMGQKLSIVGVIEIAAEAGWGAIEPWVREIDDYAAKGGSPADLSKRIRDAGLEVPSAIGFFDWAVDDDARRKKGFEEARRNFEIVAKIGGKRLAAPPSGAINIRMADLRPIADRYRELIELGRGFGVVPQVELWGFSKTLSRLGEVAYVAIESGHPEACILPDVFHLYKGGSNPEGLRLLSGSAINVIHINDYPADPPRERIDDSYRVYPGEGSAPLTAMLRSLKSIGFHGWLSLELFNRGYWKLDAKEVAKTGLEKTRAAVKAAELDHK